MKKDCNKDISGIITDYHVHPSYSIDAYPVKMRDYCCRAIELGLAEICFTTHLECDPVRKEMDNFVMLRGDKHPVEDQEWLDYYFEDIEKVREEFRPDGLEIRAGLEVGFDLGQEKIIENYLKNYNFDFVLGAIHCLEHIAISSMQESPHYFAGREITEVRDSYFRTVDSAVDTGFFHCLAHLDLYLRYGIKYFGPDIFYIHRGIIEPILEKMASRGIGLEINTSSRRRGLETFHPSEEIISLAAQAGVKIFTTGSDAHCLEDLGSCIREAQDVLDKYGLQNHIFIKGHPFPVNNLRFHQEK